MSMMRGTLSRPDDARTQREAGYSPVVAARLTSAYVQLKRAATNPDASRLAFEDTLACLSLPMSASQRMRVFYVLGSTLLGGEAVEPGIEYLDEALAVADGLHDWLAWAELAYLAGSARRSLIQHGEAAAYFEEGLRTLRAAFTEDGVVAADLELELLTRAADCALLTEEYDRARLLLSEASTLLQQSRPSTFTRADVEWMWSRLLRWEHHPEQALMRALAANDIYATANTPVRQVSFGRLQIVIADLFLDLAEGFSLTPPRFARDTFISLAQPYVERAYAVTQRLDDAIGEQLAVVAHARFDRVADRNVEPLEALAIAAQRGKELGDVFVVAEARTAMGRELIARGWTDSGLKCYRETLDILRFTEAPAFGKWAREELVAASGQHI